MTFIGGSSSKLDCQTNSSTNSGKKSYVDILKNTSHIFKKAEDLFSLQYKLPLIFFYTSLNRQKRILKEALPDMSSKEIDQILEIMTRKEEVTESPNYESLEIMFLSIIYDSRVRFVNHYIDSFIVHFNIIGWCDIEVIFNCIKIMNGRFHDGINLKRLYKEYIGEKASFGGKLWVKRN